MDDRYRLGIFANMYPGRPGDHSGIFIKRMVDDLIERGVDVTLAVKSNCSILGYPAFFAESIRLCHQKESDLFQAHYIPHSSLIPALLKGNTPLILKFHGDDARIFPFKSPIHRAVIQWMIKRSVFVITSSEEMRQTLIKIGADSNRSAAIASGVDTDRYIPMPQNECREEYGIHPERMVFLYLGRYHPWKGIYELIEAARLFPDDLFIFAGTGTLPAHPDNCIGIGAIEPERVPTLMNTADCLLLPSYTEGLPNVLMEALSCAVPVIATDVGGCSEVVKDGVTGLLIPPKDVPALQNALVWMKQHPDERKKMGVKGRSDMIERYEIQHLITRMIQIHRDILEGRL